MPAVITIVTDLIFSTKIFSTAKTLNVPMAGARSLAALAERQAEGASLVILDLNVTALDPIAAIRQIKSTASADPPRIVAFLSHVQVDLAAAAKAAGADEVLPRSAFVMKLPDLLASCIGSSTHDRPSE